MYDIYFNRKICLKFASICLICLISYLTILLSWHKSWYNVCILKFYQVVWLLDWETQSLLFHKLRLGNRKHLLPILAMVALVLYIILRSCCWKSRQFFCGQGLFSTIRNKNSIENYLYHINYDKLHAIYARSVCWENIISADYIFLIIAEFLRAHHIIFF